MLVLVANGVRMEQHRFGSQRSLVGEMACRKGDIWIVKVPSLAGLTEHHGARAPFKHVRRRVQRVQVPKARNGIVDLF